MTPFAQDRQEYLIKGVGFPAWAWSYNDMELAEAEWFNANPHKRGCKSWAVKEGKETSNSSEEDWNC